MMVTLMAAKGSPGVTSAALVTAAAWPTGCLLVEADPAGADLSLRCRTRSGDLAAAPNLLGLAASVRSGADPAEFGQNLACGVRVVPGVTSPAQGRTLAGLWGTIGSSLKASSVDVIVDIGRADTTAPTTALVTSSDAVVVVCEPTPRSVVHTRALLSEFLTLPALGRTRVMPLIVSPPRHGEADAHDLDAVLAAAGLPVEPTAFLARDPQGLAMLESGHDPSTKAFKRTALARSSTALTTRLTPKPHAAEVLA